MDLGCLILRTGIAILLLGTVMLVPGLLLGTVMPVPGLLLPGIAILAFTGGVLAGIGFITIAAVIAADFKVWRH